MIPNFCEVSYILPSSQLTDIEGIMDLSNVDEWHTSPVESGHHWSQDFSLHLKPRIAHILTSRQSSSFVHLILLNIPAKPNGIRLPIVAVYISNESEVESVYDSLINDLQTEPRFDGFVLSVSCGSYEEYSATSLLDRERTFDCFAQWGVSIGYQSSAATAGPILRNDVTGDHYVLTVAHVFKEKTDNDGQKSSIVIPDRNGRVLTQPAYADYLTEKNFLERYLKRLDGPRGRLSTASAAARPVLLHQIEEIKARLAELDVLGASLDEFAVRAKYGIVEQSKYGIHEYNGRRTFLDYSLIKITDRKVDRDMFIWPIVPDPPVGQLSDHDWTNSAFQTLGGLSFDLDVWKRGRETSFTFGRVGGTEGLQVNEEAQITDEYWVLRDCSPNDTKSFAAPTDSGALVVSRGGSGCGIVLGGWNRGGKAFKMPVDQNRRLWDLKRLYDLRRPDGSLDLSNTICDLCHRGVVIISDLEMVLKNIGLNLSPVV